MKITTSESQANLPFGYEGNVNNIPRLKFISEKSVYGRNNRE